MTTKFRCSVCGKLTVGRVPKHGDGSLRYPRYHRGADGQPCEGRFQEAEWVDVEENAPTQSDNVYNKTRCAA